MNFQSTRDEKCTKYNSAQVIKQGLADDGGLFVPECIPTLTEDEIKGYTLLSYPELAATVLSKFLTDYTYDELLIDACEAYSTQGFPDGACPLINIDNEYFLELWHGPTCAFKDMALQIMPRLLSRALKKTGETRTSLVLVATSGDTGKAALEGYKNIPNVKIAVFYPEDGVSTVQKLQMMTQDGNNVNVCGAKGNFDDIQTAIKNIFNSYEASQELDEKGYFFSSANSINFGRLAPQIVYYIHSYCSLLASNDIEFGEKIDICVPTGNFGNILAAYIAKLMGLPIDKLICASNSNNILTDFLNTGRYDRTSRSFHKTISPSMDILISSNLERLLYLVSGPTQTSEWMQSLNKNGYYEIDPKTKAKIDETFVGYFADEETTKVTIKNIFEEKNYLIDPHTAVAFAAVKSYRESYGNGKKIIIASTASPYKFAKDVYQSIMGDANQAIEDTKYIDALEMLSGVKAPMPLVNIESQPVNFPNSTSIDGIYAEVLRFISEIK